MVYLPWLYTEHLVHKVKVYKDWLVEEVDFQLYEIIVH